MTADTYRRAGAIALLFGLVAFSWTSSASSRPQGGEAASDSDNPYGPEEGGEKRPEAVSVPSGSRPSSPAAGPKTVLPRSGVAAPDTRSSAARAYQTALKRRRLAATEPLSLRRLRGELATIESKVLDGRRDEAIGDLVTIVESPRFDPLAGTDEGRAMLFTLGDALGRAGAYEPARGYLVRLLTGSSKDTWYRKAVRSLVDLGLESSDAAPFLADLSRVPRNAPPEMRGDIAYLRGRNLERTRNPTAALREYSRVGARSRFWAQATYLSGLIEVERSRLKQGEKLFCRVADPELTPRQAPVFGGSDFFRIRDLARLALGRVAHEQYRFDDARYYYYLVPSDSDLLPQALYESATSRYESKDYGGARDLMDELRSLDVNHPYQDEAWLLDAFIDLASCDFPAADAKLAEFTKRYEPVRNAARRLVGDEVAMRRLLEAVRVGADPAAAGTGLRAPVARTLGALLRLDAAYAQSARRIAHVEHQLGGLRGAMQELDDARLRLANPKKVRPHRDERAGGTPQEKVERIEAQLAEVRRSLREASRARRRKGSEKAIDDLGRELDMLQIRARTARASLAADTAGSPAPTKGLMGLLAADRARATRLYANAERLRTQLIAGQLALAKGALARLDRRLSRLLARARLGRIETVLGQKRALEIEVEALSQGMLPQAAVDSLDAARYLRDDEEYWPFDGEDWADEYVGGEGLR